MPISRVVDVRAELKMEVGMLKVRLISEGASADDGYSRVGLPCS